MSTIGFTIQMEPSGSPLAVASGMVMNLALPATGTYDVVIDAGYGETVATEVLLSAGEGSPFIDGATSTHALSRAGRLHISRSTHPKRILWALVSAT